MRIVIGVDGSSASAVACDLVASRPWPIGTRVSLVAAIEPAVDWTGLSPVDSEVLESERGALEMVLEDGAASLRRCGLAVETFVELGRAADVLMSHADETFADLIVVGSRGLGPAASAVFGSVSAHLVDHAACPVLVARSPAAHRMLLATDGTESSRSIPRVLAAWRDAFRSLQVEVLTVAPRDLFVTPWSDERLADDELVEHEGIAEEVASDMARLGWDAIAVARRGEPQREIVEESRHCGADLIVTGSRGIGTLRRLLGGSVAHDVLLHARSSLLVVRGHVPAHITENARVVAMLAAI
jgi:nucleotide-binding universal stress UspA family protein